jgi:hypothetical protein
VSALISVCDTIPSFDGLRCLNYAPAEPTKQSQDCFGRLDGWAQEIASTEV